MPFDNAKPDKQEIAQQLERICASTRFERAPVQQELLRFLLKEYLADGGTSLTGEFIGRFMGESPVFESDRSKEGFPKTRSNLQHVRKRLNAFYETAGYSDRVVIRLPNGSYIPAVAFNPAYEQLPPVGQDAENLILGAKTMLDLRTMRALGRSLDYLDRLTKYPSRHPRLLANQLFIPFVAAPILPASSRLFADDSERCIRQIQSAGFEPWECTFAAACLRICAHHNWQEAEDLFETAIANSQGEATYFWWYTSLLASRGKLNEAIDLLYAAVRHMSRTNVAMRVDLAVLLVIARRYEEAEEIIAATTDFAAPHSPAIWLARFMLYEAQDRKKDAAEMVLAFFRTFKANPGAFDTHGMLLGMISLIAGKEGSTDTAKWMLDSLARGYKRHGMFSSVERAIALIGNHRYDDAVGCLEKGAFKEHDPFTMWLGIFPPLRQLHTHRKYRELLKRLNLVCRF